MIHVPRNSFPVRPRSALPLCAIAALALACGEDSSASDVDAILEQQDVDETVVLFSWWIEGGEQAAFGEFLAAHATRYPDASIINATADFGDRARDELADMLAESRPPDLFQANVGADQKKWVLFNDQDDSETKLAPVDFLADALGLDAVIHPAVLEAASYDGKLYGIPVNVHRINSLVLNLSAFERCGAEPPTTLAEFRAAAQALEDCGVTPISLGNQWNWTLSLLVSEVVFPAYAGADGYSTFWRGGGDPADPAMAAALAEVMDWQAQGWFNADSAETDWAPATARLMCADPDADPACRDAGGDPVAEAGMTIMGDWAKGALEDRGWVAGEDFDVIGFPAADGVEEAFIFTADTFCLPLGAANRDGAVRVLATMIDVESQIAFNRKKGSLPARTDVPMDDFDSVQRKIRAAFDALPKAVALSGIIPPRDAFVDWSATLKEALADGDEEVALLYLTNHYSELE